MEANYFTILWWFLPYIDMNQPWVYMCLPVLNPSPTSLPIPSFWIVKASFQELKSSSWRRLRRLFRTCYHYGHGDETIAESSETSQFLAWNHLFHLFVFWWLKFWVDCAWPRLMKAWRKKWKDDWWVPESR